MFVVKSRYGKKAHIATVSRIDEPLATLCGKYVRSDWTDCVSRDAPKCKHCIEQWKWIVQSRFSNWLRFNQRGIEMPTSFESIGTRFVAAVVAPVIIFLT